MAAIKSFFQNRFILEIFIISKYKYDLFDCVETGIYIHYFFKKEVKYGNLNSTILRKFLSKQFTNY